MAPESVRVFPETTTELRKTWGQTRQGWRSSGAFQTGAKISRPIDPKSARQSSRAPSRYSSPAGEIILAGLLSEFADLCQSTASLEEIEQDLQVRLAEFGVCHFVHVEALDANGQPSGALLAGPSNQEWRSLYFEQGWAPHDDLMRSGLKSVLPSTWLGFQKRQPVSKGQRDIFGAAETFGFRDGYFLPIHQLDGSVACVSLFSNEVLPVKGPVATVLHMLSLYYSFAVRRLAAPASRPVKAGVQLTPRQRECLQWVRAGKTDWEIGQIIGISEHTVIEHLEQARRRLDVRTRTQAVIEAVSRGIIHI